MRRIASREIDKGKQVTKRDKEYKRDSSKRKEEIVEESNRNMDKKRDSVIGCRAR